ncbi:MAG: hypothetical protein NTU89_01920 [Candidatus Dependentiae bacterium]|nr:hypothetical protein [Candidatus Dependentiae bacterium]
MKKSTFIALFFCNSILFAPPARLESLTELSLRKNSPPILSKNSSTASLEKLPDQQSPNKTPSKDSDQIVNNSSQVMKFIDAAKKQDDDLQCKATTYASGGALILIGVAFLLNAYNQKKIQQ